MLFGGQGSDTLTGDAGADTFIWRSGDEAGGPVPIDTITDFNLAEGDAIDISDLLGNVSEDAATLDDYLNFSQNGSDTQINIDQSGNVNATTTQTIVLSNVDLTSGGTLSDQQIINDLLLNNNIVTDTGA